MQILSRSWPVLPLLFSVTLVAQSGPGGGGDGEGRASESSTNVAPLLTVERQTRSAVVGDDSQPPLAEWAASAEGSPTAENAMFNAVLAADLNTVGSLRVTVPGDSGLPTELRGTVLGLAYIEPGEEGRSVVIAEVRSSAPEWLSPHQVIYANALLGPGVVADVVYELTRYSVAQDVVIRGRIPDRGDTVFRVRRSSPSSPSSMTHQSLSFRCPMQAVMWSCIGAGWAW